MTLAQKYVHTVYREESFSKAAKKLFISQPSLSEMVKRLEKELGFLIFDRSKSPLKLTPQGMLYMKYLEEAIENERVMLARIRSISEIPSQELIIGGGSILSRSILPLVCGEFLKLHPDVNIKLDFSDGVPYGSTAEKLENDRMNFALLYSYHPRRMTGIPLMKEQFFLAFTRDCPGAKDLEPFAMDIDSVMVGKEFTVDQRLYDSVPKEMRIIFRDFYTSDPKLETYINQFPSSHCRVINSHHRGVFYDLMLAGLGALFVTDQIAAIERYRCSNVLFVPIDNRRTLNVVYKKDRILSDEENAFISVLSEKCGQLKSHLFQ